MSPHTPVWIYTGLLAAVGAINVLFAAVIGIDARSGSQELLVITRTVQALLLLFAFMFFWVAFLRIRRSRKALYSTRVISILMLLIVPWGTAASLIWFAWVRRFDEELFES